MYLVINQGLKSIRIIVFDDEAKVIYSDSLPIHTFLKNNRVEQDVNEWKDLLFKLLNVLNSGKKDNIFKYQFGNNLVLDNKQLSIIYNIYN